MKTITLVVLLTIYLPVSYSQGLLNNENQVKKPNLVIDEIMLNMDYDIVKIKKQLLTKGYIFEKTNRNVPNTIEYEFAKANTTSKVYVIFDSFGVALKCSLTEKEYQSVLNYELSQNRNKYFFNDSDDKFCLLSKQKSNSVDTLKTEIIRSEIVRKLCKKVTDFINEAFEYEYTIALQNGILPEKYRKF